ncbi:hypothetical protein ABBQ38_012892 [Trebouxia sp. C0009 RCD-2024]
MMYCSECASSRLSSRRSARLAQPNTFLVVNWSCFNREVMTLNQQLDVCELGKAIGHPLKIRRLRRGSCLCAFQIIRATLPLQAIVQQTRKTRKRRRTFASFGQATRLNACATYGCKVSLPQQLRSMLNNEADSRK